MNELNLSNEDLKALVEYFELLIKLDAQNKAKEATKLAEYE
jgi:hypothetical protein